MTQGKRPATVTIRDVADRAGVALSSVSRVLSGRPNVSERMRQRVTVAAQELGYEPDLLAQGLRRGTTRTVGFVLRDISNPLFANVARSSEQGLRRAGYSLLLTNSDGDVGTESADLAVLRRRRIDGLIISLVSETEERTRRSLADFGGPVVLLDREVTGLRAARVLCDHYSGVLAATTRLLELGHRRIALVTGGLEVRSSRERRRAFLDAFEKRKLAADPSLMLFGEFDYDFAASSVSGLLRAADPPTAVVAGGVLTTAGTLRALREGGQDPGTDIAVVALDGWPMFDVLPQPIGLVTRDPVEMGTLAAELMLEVIRTGRPRTITVPTVFHDNAAIPRAPKRRS